MQLTLSRRVMFVVLGFGATVTGVLCAARGWSAASVPLIVAGTLMVAAAIVGQLPSGNLKELQLRWRDQDLYDRVDQLQQALTNLGNSVNADLRSVREATTAVGDKLDDYLLALEPDPVDDYADGEERLRDWEEHLHELGSEISSRQYSGEDYDDGVGLEELKRAWETSSRDLERERRRQEARRRYGHLRNVPTE